MIELKEVCYTRLGTKDLETSAEFATQILGLQSTGGGHKDQYFRSDDRSHTLYYFEGDPNDQVVGFEIAHAPALEAAGATLDALGHPVHRGTKSECDARHVVDFIRFRDPTGTTVEVALRPEMVGKRYFASRDAGITGFSHVGLFSRDPVKDETFWTQVCNARVSDRIGDVPLLRVNAIHHTIALIPAPRSGIQHINHQVVSTDDVMRSYSLLQEHRIPIVFGPGRHPTSGARFLYFEGPDGMVFEYSVGVSEVNEETYRERQFGFEPSSLCMWGSKAQMKELAP